MVEKIVQYFHDIILSVSNVSLVEIYLIGDHGVVYFDGFLSLYNQIIQVV